MTLVTYPDGSRRLTTLFPPIPTAKVGDSFSGSMAILAVSPDSRGAFVSGGIVVEATPAEDMVLLPPAKNPPLAVRSALLRQRLCTQLLALSPAPATAVTAGVLFSYRDAMPLSLRQAFQRSGMAHILSVSGLHLSILVWGAVALVRRLGRGRGWQAAVGASMVLLLFFAVGLSPALFRAGVMVLLTLAGTLFGRKSDGLTSLALAATLLVFFCPPLLGDVGFQLSFLATLGILVLAPRFHLLSQQFLLSRFGRVGPVARWLLPALSITAAAQLFTAPVVAWVFGAVPLLGLPINLLAVPLVYPILLFGLLCCLAGLFGFLSLAAVFLVPANICSLLLSALATFAASLPLCSLPTRFPLDFLVVGLSLALCLWFAFRPAGLRHARPLLLAGLLTLGLAGGSLWLSYAAVTVVSSAATGSLAIVTEQGAVLLDCANGNYQRRLDDDLLAGLGHANAIRLPMSIDPTAPSPTPITPLSGITVAFPTPYVTEFAIGNTKLVKYFAVYDTIMKYGGHIPTGDVLLADRQGNLLSLGGKRYILRRANGESSLRIYR